ncbi:MAG TPA: TIR domain-containing protein [Solirubrobacteraceae bacterium]|nr:TIR domain-containing protein [Solirubrobacteraceae bacterium]
MAPELDTTMLRVSRPIVTELLGRHIEQGEALMEQAGFIGEVGDHERWRAARHQWIDLTVRTLDHVYEGSEQAEHFRSSAAAPPDGEPWQVECKRDSTHLRAAIDLMIDLRDQLELEQEMSGEAAPESADEPDARNGREPANGRESDTPRNSTSGRKASASGESEPEREPEPQREPERKPEEQPAEDAAPVDTSPVGAELAPAPSVHAALEQAHAVSSELSHEPAGRPASPLSNATTADLLADGTGRVFLVHGRNDRWKHAVAGLLERAGTHEVTILNERPGDRMPLVEHFDEQPGSRYGIVLLTADDIGAARVDSDREPFFSPRPLQGVVFAMGILVAALTPRCVCVLYEDGVELPCDLDGITYVRLDGAGTWQSKLLLQLRGAGLDYDLNRLAAHIA